MNQDDKKWAFTEFLGWKDDVEKTIREMQDANLLHGRLCSLEEKGDKRFIQFYSCNERVDRLTEEEMSRYDEISLRNYVHIEYTFNGRESLAFPLGEKEGFPIKYWEWWMMK